MTDKMSTQNTLLSRLTQNKSLLSSSLLTTGDSNKQDARKRKSDIFVSSDTKRSKEVATLTNKLQSDLRLTSPSLTSSLTSSLSLKSSLLSSPLSSPLLQSALAPKVKDVGQDNLKVTLDSNKFKVSLDSDKFKVNLDSDRLKGRVTKVKGHLAGGRQEGGRKREKVKKLSPESGKVVKKHPRKSDKIPADIAARYRSREFPQYDLHRDGVVMEMRLPRFLPPERDSELIGYVHRPLHDINGLKLGLINSVSASLIAEPNFKNDKDKTRDDLTEMASRVVCYDPEFLLKVALYSRKELNIRTTSNFLLSLAAKITECRPYLKKYFSAAINLPSDWIEVAEIYQAFHDKNINFGSLPAALRRAMASKFPDFDKYQLAKYNKDSSKKKKKKMGPGNVERGRGRGVAYRRGAGRPGLQARSSSPPLSSDSDGTDSEDEEVEGVTLDEKEESREELKQKTFTLKQLIRKLHITEPVEHVMCLIGKKYPATLEEFYQCRLPGTWEEERAGKRMKLPVPETWETQVSLKGNKASTWQQLIDNKKLPFMAMLRNLRNLIKAGVSPSHHNQIIKRLTDERQVVNSKQFPFRFFSAYEALNQLLTEYENNQKALVDEAVAKAEGRPVAPPPVRGRGRGRGGGRGGRGGAQPKGTGVEWWVIKQAKKKAAGTREVLYDAAIISRYKKALDSAVQIATKYNVQPIRGRTWIFCEVSGVMNRNCSSARGLGKPRTLKEIGVLMGLMCKYSCEDCDMIIFDGTFYDTVHLKPGTILDNMDTVLQSSPDRDGAVLEYHSRFPDRILYDAIKNRTEIDNLIIVSDTDRDLNQFLSVYRRLVNPNLIYASINLSPPKAGFSSIVPEHDNDIYLSGYSDHILRFIVERGEGGQLLHVENIDGLFKLKPLPTVALKDPPSIVLPSPETPLPVPLQVPRWRTGRVFISSTFRDMHGERDLLTRFVFPELRERARKQFVNIFEVDLRWGVSEEAARCNRTLRLCLDEVRKCEFFIGILGDRYGFVPDQYDVPDTKEYDWLKEYPIGASVTELEMYYGALSGVSEVAERAFFYIRDEQVLNEIPVDLSSHFNCDSLEACAKLFKLKQRIRTSGLEVYDGYPSKWAGVVDNKAVVGGLESFGERVLNNLWTAVQKYYPQESAMLDEESHITNLHEAFIEDRGASFIGRLPLVKQCVERVISLKSGLLALVGKSGSGKSSLMCRVVQTYKENKACPSAGTIVVHMVGAAPGSTNLVPTLRRVCHQLNSQFSLHMTVPEEYRNLVVKFGEMLEEAGKMSPSKVVLFFDGVDLMEDSHQPYSLEWLPQVMPPNVVMVMSVLEGEKFHKSMKRLGAGEITVSGLDVFDKSEIIRKTLAVHRKTLDESPFNNQLKLLVSKKEAPNPLFLKLACDELRVFGVFEQLSEKLKTLPHSTSNLLQEILSRLEVDHDKQLVSTALSLLTLVRDGLEPEELMDLLNWQRKMEKTRFIVSDMRNMRLDEENKLPPMSFSFLLQSIRCFLNPTGTWNTQLNLSHHEIIQAVRHRYLKVKTGSDAEMALHKLLAGYFYSKADINNSGRFEGKDTRAFSQLVYHLTCSGSYDELKNVICNPCYIRQKCLLGLATELLEDYFPKSSANMFTERQQTKFFSSPHVQDYKSFISRNIHILTRHPALTWQQIMNEPETSQVLHDLRHLDAESSHSMKWVNKPEHADPCYHTIDNLKETVTSVAISPDNTCFATGSADCIVRLYNLNTGKELQTYCGHSDPIADVCFAGRSMLISASYDNSISIWHVDNGHRIHVLKNHKRRVNSVTSDVTGKLVASASWDCTVRVWLTGSGEQTCCLPVGSPVNCVDFHPEGQLLVTGSWDSLIKIYDVFHKTRKAVLRGHASSVRDVSYSPSGRHIASASLDGEVKLWSALNGTLISNIQGHAGPINKLTFTSTGKELVTVSNDQKVKIWSGHLGCPVHCLGSDSYGPAMAVVLSKDGNLVVVGYHEGHVLGFDVKSGQQRFKVKHSSSPVCAVRFTHDQRNIMIGVSDGGILIIDKVNGQRVCHLSGHTKTVLTMATSRDFIVSGGQDFTCCVFNNSDLHSKPKQISAEAVVHYHTAPVTSCSFNKKETLLAVGSRDCSVSVWDIKLVILNPEAPPLYHLLTCHSDWVNACIWSNMADNIVTASNDFNVKVWDVSMGKTEKMAERKKLTGHMAAINCLDYQYGCILSGSSDGQVKVWSHKGTEITTLYGHTLRVNGCSLYVRVKTRFEEGEREERMEWCDEEQEEEEEEKKLSRLREKKLSEVIAATCSDDGMVRIWKPLKSLVEKFILNEPVVSLTTYRHSNGHNYFLAMDTLGVCYNKKCSGGKFEKQDSFYNNKHLQFNNSIRFKMAASKPSTILLLLETQIGFITCQQIDKRSPVPKNNISDVEDWSQQPLVSSDGWDDWNPQPVVSVLPVEYKEIPVTVDESHIPRPKQEKNWILDVTTDATYFYCGDSKGQITVGNLKDRSVEFTYKVHGMSINCVVCSEGFLFTGSSDSSIKVWDLAAIHRRDMKNAQVGLFYCASPVLKMALVSSSSNSKNVNLISGDKLGNINVLTWITG